MEAIVAEQEVARRSGVHDIDRPCATGLAPKRNGRPRRSVVSYVQPARACTVPAGVTTLETAMPHRKTLTVAALALLTAAPALLTVVDAQPAQRAGADRPDRGRGAMDRDYEGLGLTDEQRGRLRAMDEEQGREMAQFEERERLARRALEGLVPGAAGYAAARERYEEAQRQTQDARNRHRDRRDGVLTPDQRRTVGERRTSRGERGVGNDRRDDRREDRRDDRREDRRDKR
jgi:Spy/CpxP family protein refolding chaperone